MRDVDQGGVRVLPVRGRRRSRADPGAARREASAEPASRPPPGARQPPLRTVPHRFLSVFIPVAGGFPQLCREPRHPPHAAPPRLDWERLTGLSGSILIAPATPVARPARAACRVPSTVTICRRRTTMSVLVTYASMYGATEEIATRVAETSVSYTHLRAHETRHDLVC